MVTVPPSVVKRTSPLVPTATVTGIVTTSPAVQRTFADVGWVAPVGYTYIELVVVPDKAVTDSCTELALLGTEPTPRTGDVGVGMRGQRPAKHSHRRDRRVHRRCRR